MQRNYTVTRCTVTKIIIEVSKFGFVCFSIQILTLVSLQDYLWVLETVSVVISLVSNKCTQPSPSIEFWLVQSGGDPWCWGWMEGWNGNQHHLVTSNLIWSKRCFCLFLPPPPRSFLSDSCLQRCLALKYKVMNAVCACGWFHLTWIHF